jgi:uncharacterized protein (DUF2147 family)
MKRLLLSIAAATALAAPPAAQAADPVYGVWVREGHPTDKLEFFDCGGKLCAKGIRPMLDGRPAPLVIRNAAKTGPNSWKGDLFNPEDGKTYTGKITYDSPDQLTLTGCLVAFLCQSEQWSRVSGPTKPSADKAEGKPDAKGHDSHDAAKGGAADAKAGDKPADKATDKAAKAAAPKTAAPAKPAAPKAAAPARPKPAEDE